MKKIIPLLALLCFTMSYSQLYVPYGQIVPTDNPSSSNIGIGTPYPSSRLDVNFDGESKTMKFIGFPNQVNSLNAALRYTWYTNYADIGIVRGGATDIKSLSIKFNGTETASFLPSGSFVIGGKEELGRLTINGGHDNTTFLMHSDNDVNPHAYLSLWASEPIASYNGVGIGNNIRNYDGSTAFVRINAAQGGSYIRLLDNEINFNLISSSGVKQTPFNLHANGNASLQGKFEAKEVKVTVTPTADFVFADDYSLPKLEDVEKHIKKKSTFPISHQQRKWKRKELMLASFR